jgi:tungstate transport system ATP-binding protein
MTAIMKQITLQDIHKSFGARRVLQGTTLSLESGKCYLLTGPNGVGKSTLLRICAGLEKPDSGFVKTEDGLYRWKHYRKVLRAQTVYLHQTPYMFDGNVIQNMAYALRGRSSKTERDERINMALRWAGLDDGIATSWARTLSGGERQRVALARAWLCSPNIMLLDEPTNNLDEEAKQRTIALLMSLKAQGIILLIATHETNRFDVIANEKLELAHGQLTASPMPNTGNTNVIPHGKNFWTV